MRASKARVEGPRTKGRLSPSPKHFRKIEFETIYFGAHLKRTFELNDITVRDHVQLFTFMNKFILNILCEKIV